MRWVCLKSQCVFLLRFSGPQAGCRRNALSGGQSGSFLQRRGWSRGVCPGGAVGAEALRGVDAVERRGERAAFEALADRLGIKPQASKRLGLREHGEPQARSAYIALGLWGGCDWDPLSWAAPALSSLSGHGTPFKVGVSHVLPHEPPCRGAALLCVALSRLGL